LKKKQNDTLMNKSVNELEKGLSKLV